ncbi:ABC transporter ATP-binding protein [Solidesulfovibrio sp.]|jgi:lipoprotein-releasing system ATP-binding protein|uniref:ABC transporter ATP-binding protein n=1 Tax=Solidesulfovibrio sp. TaxID=2910990 RepID=UPI000ED4255F|nr:ABC transporter ATP-binding protein [Solidesulfovibrio sp.]MEA5087796.1 ABC transporter ATP-binding protein [Solidesulfovibrio sp.]HCR12911.1 ABC transporter ATP-binding protein [Desulfovibrio sp.]HML59910.1 ABC transporter ATP-binding protein [Solidesulfovibrio sp.]
MTEPLYALRGLRKVYQGPAEEVVVLKGLDFEIPAGDSMAILGASGSGKSSLLHLLGALDRPTAGEIRFRGRDLASLAPAEAARVRNREIGFVFQFHHLLPEFTTLENVAMPALIAKIGRREAFARAKESLSLVGLDERAEHRVTTLSGGERQRAAIARAVLLRPVVLLADEPTGNLDEATGAKVGDVLARLNAELGMTLVVVTHNHNLAAGMGRRLELQGGELYARNETSRS